MRDPGPSGNHEVDEGTTPNGNVLAAWSRFVKMASVQRDHWSYVVLQCLLLSLLICRHGAYADRNKYFHISSLCAGQKHYPQYKKIDGAVLTSESENNLECAVTFQTDSILQRFMLRFERLALDCHDHLVIFDGAHAIGNHKVDLSCRSTRSDVGTIFTQGNYVTLRYTTDAWSPQGNGFKLIITAYKDSTIPDIKQDLQCREFECRNSFCISSDLMCDGVNHCGDNSDETSFASCIDAPGTSHILGLGVSLAVTLILIMLVVCIIGCAAGVLCICRRQHSGITALQAGAVPTSAVLQMQGNSNFSTGASYGGTAERLSEKPPPYPGNNGPPPGGGIAFHVPQETLYYK